MGLCVIFVSGPRQCGKSAVIQTMGELLWKNKPHYLRLVAEGPDHKRRQPDDAIPAMELIASTRWLWYDPERIFEVLPEALSAIHKKDRFGAVVIEADADPNLRRAYPYDHRVFVMPLPGRVREVFREPARAAQELQRALDDTAAFASEIFGLFDRDDGEPSEPRPELTAAQMRGFLYSPLGDELATRIQLQPPFHGLVESDVIVINSTTRDPGPETEECVRRIHQLLLRIRGAGARKTELFLCDPTQHGDPSTKKLLTALKPMCHPGA